MTLNIREKLLKEDYKEQEDIKSIPVIGLLDISNDEFEFLKENGIKTIEDMVTKWKKAYNSLIKKIPKDRVNSWIAGSKLLLVGEKERITTGAKIILAGIDNVGKTSLSIALKHRGALSLLFQRLYALTPTRGLLRSKIEVFGMDIHLNELGGQLIYREDYLQNPEQYFLGTDILIYIVDVQAVDRYEESIEYLKQIVQVTKALKINIPWMLFFHKSDPDFELTAKAADVFNSMVNYIDENVEFFEPAKNIFRTTVKLRSTVLGAFSHIFRNVVLIKDSIYDASKQVAEKLNADYFGLYDFRSNVCFAQYSKRDDLEELSHNAYYEAIETIVNMREPFLRVRRYSVDENLNENFILRDVKFGDERYIMAMLTPDEEIARNLDQDSIEEVIDEYLNDWIEFRSYAKFPME